MDTLAEVLARAGYRNGYISDCMPVFQQSGHFHLGGIPPLVGFASDRMLTGKGAGNE